MRSAGAAGTSGSLLVGSYQLAARLGSWQVRLAPRLPRSYDLSAAISWRDEYWITQRPLRIVVEVGDATWEWAGIEPAIGGDGLSVGGLGIPTVVRWAKQREG